MRISDWSSDVCSSDLPDDADAVKTAPGPRIIRKRTRLSIPDSPHLGIFPPDSMPFMLFQRRFDLASDLVDARHAVDGFKQSFLPVVGQNRCGAPMVCMEPRPHRLRVVVGATRQLRRNANVAHTTGRGPPKSPVKAGD